MPYLEEYYDIVVVGAGHAGCEAALACARLGLETIVFTISIDSIALMRKLKRAFGKRVGCTWRGDGKEYR